MSFGSNSSQLSITLDSDVSEIGVDVDGIEVEVKVGVLVDVGGIGAKVDGWVRGNGEGVAIAVGGINVGISVGRDVGTIVAGERLPSSSLRSTRCCPLV